MKLSLSTEWLLFHLWKNNPETGQSCPGVIIPDTIIYRFSLDSDGPSPIFGITLQMMAPSLEKQRIE